MTATSRPTWIGASTHSTGGSTRLEQDLQEEERSFGQIVGDLTTHTQDLIKGELAIAKRELADNAKQVGGAAAIGGVAVPFGFAAVGLLGMTIAFALAEAMPIWAGFLIATVLYLAIAGVCALVAKQRIAKANLAPTNSIESAKEDLTWIKQHAK